jgi:hypothetical protein
MAAMPIAPLLNISTCVKVYFSEKYVLKYLPRVSTAELLTQVRDQKAEGLKNKRMPALGILLDGLFEDLVDGLMAVVCALLLYRMGNPIGDSISCRHDSVWEREVSIAVNRGLYGGQRRE